MMAQRRGRRANISPALGQHLVFAGPACDCTMEIAGQTDRQKGQCTERTKVGLNQHVPISVYRGVDIIILNGGYPSARLALPWRAP